jgi:hypothetical protein
VADTASQDSARKLIATLFDTVTMDLDATRVFQQAKARAFRRSA